MSDKPEPLAAILAEMREYDNTPPPKRAWLDLADRIEVAVERERNAHTNDIHDALYKATGIPGNAAAMRESIETMRRYAMLPQEELSLSLLQRTIHEKCDAALAAPARNCDRYADELDAQLAFLNDVWLISVDKNTMLEKDKFENWTEQMKTRYGRWLLAPAEGGNHA